MKEKRKVQIITPEEAGSPILSAKYMRNKQCHCGSGKKLKRCCGQETKYFTKKPKESPTSNPQS